MSITVVGGEVALFGCDGGTVPRSQEEYDAAFFSIVQEWRSPVIGMLCRFVKDHHSAEDVAQTVFARLHIKRHQFRQGGSFGPWIRAITRNAGLNALRPSKRHQKHEQLLNSQEVIGTDRYSNSRFGPELVDDVDELAHNCACVIAQLITRISSQRRKRILKMCCRCVARVMYLGVPPEAQASLTKFVQAFDRAAQEKQLNIDLLELHSLENSAVALESGIRSGNMREDLRKSGIQSPDARSWKEFCNALKSKLPITQQESNITVTGSLQQKGE